MWATGELAGFGQRHLPGLAEQVVATAPLPAMTEWEEVQAEYRGVGYAIGRHVVSYFRPRLPASRPGRRPTSPSLGRGGEGVPGSQPKGGPRRGGPRRGGGLVVRAGGLVIVRQRPETASHLVFLTLEDETGLFNAIVYPQTYERRCRVLRGEPLSSRRARSRCRTASPTSSCVARR